MSYIWSALIIISILFSLFTGNVIKINDVILTTSFEALKSYAFIASNIILWSGILEVCINSGMLKYISFLLKPIIRPLFLTKNEEILDLISANLTCNIMSLGSASTPFAIKAMNKLQEESLDKNKESKDMATLVIINACGFSLLPTSLIAMRANFNGGKNDVVIFYIILISLVTTIIMLLINKVGKRWV